MQDSLIDKLSALLNRVAGSPLQFVLFAAALLIVLVIVRQVLRRRRRAPIPPAADLTVPVASLGNDGPPQGPPFLECYNLPVRLAAIVLAPVGRTGALPPDDQLLPLIEAIVPGLDKIAAIHRPLIRRWPSQVSANGFAHLFFKQVRLPGDGGRGTAWSSMAGVLKVKGQPLMAGLVFRAAEPNSLGQTIIESEHQWLGCVRVRWN
jgi:hypothetical protein